MMTLLGLNAQECSSLWLTCPEAYFGQQVAYSHTYVDSFEPQEGSVTIATTGYFRLYVNGNLVSVPSYPMARAPYRESIDKTEPIAMRFDVTRYLRNDSNTITLLVCPSVLDETPAFSLRFEGISTENKLYVHDADKSWLCRPLNAYMTDYNAEFADGRVSINSICEISKEGIMSWLPVEYAEDGRFDVSYLSFTSSYEYINKVEKPKYFSVDWDEKGISYDFGKGFYGLIRVTIRDAKPGQHIYISGSEYICNGQTDEQFLLRFTASWFRKIYITGDKSFRTKNVSKVEGLQIVPKIANNLSF